MSRKNQDVQAAIDADLTELVIPEDEPGFWDYTSDEIDVSEHQAAILDEAMGRGEVDE